MPALYEHYEDTHDDRTVCHVRERSESKEMGVHAITHKLQKARRARDERRSVGSGVVGHNRDELLLVDLTVLVKVELVDHRLAVSQVTLGTRE
jgi:hypothetical protein